MSSGHRGPYALRNVLVDADLFRQLRARSGVRGRDGIGDLLAALDLVSGPPFAQRPSGYEWLNGLDLTYTAGICDVAHLVVTSALADGDLQAARAASETALRVSPEDEKVLLDAMWVAFRDGNRAEAEAFVARIVAVNDGEDEMDLHMSTAETIARARRPRFVVGTLSSTSGGAPSKPTVPSARVASSRVCGGSVTCAAPAQAH